MRIYIYVYITLYINYHSQTPFESVTHLGTAGIGSFWHAADTPPLEGLSILRCDF